MLHVEAGRRATRVPFYPTDPDDVSPFLTRFSARAHVIGAGAPLSLSGVGQVGICQLISSDCLRVTEWGAPHAAPVAEVDDSDPLTSDTDEV